MVVLNILDENRELIDIIDYASEILWSKKYYDVGGCVFKITANQYLVELFTKHAKYISRDNDDMICMVVKVSLSQNIDTGADELTITCLSLSHLLTQRIIWEQLNVNDTADICMRYLVQQCFINTTTDRQVSYIKLGDLTYYGPNVIKQISYDNLLIAIQELALTYNIGFKFTMDDNKNFIFNLYRGTDRSINQDIVDPIEFNPGLHNLQSFTYDLDLSSAKNVVLVGGEGEGTLRKKVTVGNATGINRKEMFLDNPNTSTNNGDIVTTDYNTMLIESGNAALSENSITESFNFEVDDNSYIYKVDYDLGDIITVTADYGLTLTAKIIEVIETWYSDERYDVKIIVEI